MSDSTPEVDETKLMALHEAWNEMDNAAQRIATALPFQMTEAAERLDKARLAMRKAIFDFRLSPPIKSDLVDIAGEIRGESEKASRSKPAGRPAIKPGRAVSFFAGIALAAVAASAAISGDGAPADVSVITGSTSGTISVSSGTGTVSTVYPACDIAEILVPRWNQMPVCIKTGAWHEPKWEPAK